MYEQDVLLQCIRNPELAVSDYECDKQEPRNLLHSKRTGGNVFHHTDVC
jgi:hypothetical protein